MESKLLRAFFVSVIVSAFTTVSSFLYAQDTPKVQAIDLTQYDQYSSPPTDFSPRASEWQRAAPLKIGVTTHWDMGSKLDWVVQIGLRWVRTGAGWDYAEQDFSEPPTYRWDIADRIVNDCEARHLNILFGLPYTPKWASSNGQTNGVPKDETARRHWRMFVRAAAERYKGRITHWEVWNEPNNGRFWQGSVEEYLNYIVIPAWEELKAIDSENKVVGPTLETIRGARIRVDKFFWRLADNNGAQYFDILSQNVYENLPEDIINQFEKGDYECFWIFCFKKRDSLFKIYQDSGFGNKPIWLTEFGWRADKVGEEHQASRIIDTLDRLKRRPRFDAAFIYCLQADNPWAIMEKDDTPRPVFWQLHDWLTRNGYIIDDSVPKTPGGGNEPESPEASSKIYLIPKKN